MVLTYKELRDIFLHAREAHEAEAEAQRKSSGQHRRLISRQVIHRGPPPLPSALTTAPRLLTTLRRVARYGGMG